MSGESDLNKRIATIRPELRGGTCVFVTVSPGGANPLGLGAVMSFPENIAALTHRFGGYVCGDPR